MWSKVTQPRAVRQPRRRALRSQAGRRAPAVPARSRCPLPAIPQAGAAISCPGRECAGPAAANRRRTPAERGARAAADAPGHFPRFVLRPPGPSDSGAASPRESRPGKRRRARDPSQAALALPSRGSGSAPGKGKSSPSSNLVCFWTRGRGLFVRWIDTLSDTAELIGKKIQWKVKDDDFGEEESPARDPGAAGHRISTEWTAVTEMGAIGMYFQQLLTENIQHCHMYLQFDGIIPESDEQVRSATNFLSIDIQTD
ncbi:uncharacterized protein LOC128787462 [Vidua chalybeata]|uniref:uncharacterized protein LOC128787462 n=1 Tax=Vidua chalybeata TaxID=81927 RepID=UPI0023A8FA9E|nr:uncharacterized protein LOC128787462 [Vidua chalybeata]